jgi:Peptidase family M28
MCVEAARAGALALIAVSSGAQRHFISAASLYGPPTQLEDLALLPPIPALQISKPDGDTLRNLKDATVTTVTRTRMEWRPVCMPVAHIPGREPGFLLLGAHYCTWHQGSTDNVAGVALLLELARRYAAGPKPRYGLRFAWWTGHEQGNYAGSSWYADRHWNELHEHAIGYMNVDIVGSRGATTKAIRNTSAELISFISNAVEALSEPLDSADQVFLQSALKRLDSHIDYRRPAHHSDQSFLGIGLPSLQVSSFIPSASPDHLPNSGLPWWWQTEHDTPDQCDPEVLLADTDLHHALVERLVNSAVLPFDFTLVADDFITSLGEYESAAPDFSELKALLGLAQDFRDAAICFHSALPKDADAIFLRASRLLNPVLYHTVSGYFPEHGRALRLLPGLAGTLALDRLDPPGAQMARVQLRRQCNRIEHALREVIKLFEGGRDRHIHGADSGTIGSKI